MTDSKQAPNKLSGEDLMFLTEAVFAVSSGLGTNESRARFLSDKTKVTRLMEIHDKYPNDLVEQAMTAIRDLVFNEGE